MEVAFIVGLILLGIFFMVLEVYFLPGISIAGIAGFGCMAGGVVMAYIHWGSSGGTATFGISAIALSGVLYWFYKSKTLDRMALKTEIESHVDPLKGSHVQVGDRGKTLSRLAPMGTILINGYSIEGKSENEMIDEDTEVEIIEVSNNNVTVKKIVPESTSL